MQQQTTTTRLPDVRTSGIVGVKGELSEEEQAFLRTKLSPVSRRNYVLGLRQFKQYAGIKENITMLDPKVLKAKLVDYITYLKQAGKSYSTQNQAISAIQKLYQIHDLAGINWANVRDCTSDDDTINGGENDDHPYTKEELQLLVENASPRTKAIVLTMLSTGMRIGAVPGLRMKHLQRIEDKKLYKVLVYGDSKKDRYTTFCSPECAKAIDEYLKIRQVAGEVIKPDSPVFRTQFLHRGGVGRREVNANANVKAMSKNGVFKCVEDLAIVVGIRTIRRKTATGYAQPHHKPLTHSFRKIMNTSLIRAGCKPVVVELLLGHDLGLQRNYLRLSDEELCTEYCRAIPLLTVSNETELRQQVDKLQIQISDFDTMKRAYLELKAEKEQDEGFIAHLQEAWEEERQRQQEQVLQLAEAVRDSQKAVAELRDTMEEKLREREKKKV